MKKLILLLLLVATCLPLMSCGKAKTDIVGKWVARDVWVLTFNEDGTGSDPDGGQITWEYDAKDRDYNVKVFSYNTTLDVIIDTEKDGTEFITIKGVKYYRQK